MHEYYFFDLDTLPFELYLHKHPVFLASSRSKKLTEFSNPALEKRTDHSP
jgi:hypothetical protein